MAAKFSLLALMVCFLLAAPPPAFSERRGFRASMIRRETTINFTRAARNSHERLSMLAARLDDAASRGVSTQTPLKVDGDGGAYDMEFSMGTPPQKLSALADTGSDLIWAKCGACGSCTPQDSVSYYPNQSSSFSKLPCANRLCSAVLRPTCSAGGAECDYTYAYGLGNGSHHYTMGYLGSETFTLDGDAVQGVGFGCSTMSEGGYGTGSGLVGLGRGSLSLVSQLDAGAFSYCLTTDASKTSPLLFGSLATLTGDGVQSTPLLQSSTYYSVNLKRISIGAATTAGTGDRGIIFDSGTTLTFLAEPAYSLAKAAVLNQMKLPTVAGTDGFEVCFQTSGDSTKDGIPKMVLHFDGAADMDLPVENYFVPVGNSGVLCWIVQKSPSLSIVGNVMQMNYHVRYDVDKAALSFQPANCNSP